ncbi:MAG: hypothetical protein KGD64_14030 [Candidatus Heimdallarchaeota archaeon]|nr:hypothetical protein [Candidatus Heimdallarchaeota archaeon]
MENNPDINDIVDSLLQDVESVLSKLESSFSEPISEVKKEVEKQQQTLENIVDKIPFPSVRYSTPDTIMISHLTSQGGKDIDSSKTTIIEQKIDEKQEETNHDLSTEPPRVYKEIQIPVIEQRIVDKLSKTHSEESLSESESIVSESVEKQEETLENIALENDLEVQFIDVPRSVRLLHFYGPPSSGKTTFAIQSAIEIYPRNTYYMITSHSTSTIKRIKQMISDDRWFEYKDIKKHIFPVATQNLEGLLTEIEKMKKLEPENVGLIIIDHLTDHIRGEIYKEEQRVILREILEQLYLLADEKNCKVLILNGYSYNNVAPAGDIIESYCDMTLTAELDQKSVNFITEDEEIKVCFDNSGIKNLHVNIYFS